MFCTLFNVGIFILKIVLIDIWKLLHQLLKYSIILIKVVEISSEESENSGGDVFDDHVDDFEDL